MKYNIADLKCRAARGGRAVLHMFSARYLPLQLSCVLVIILGISGFKIGDHIFSNKAQASIARMQQIDIDQWPQAERARRAKSLRVALLRAPERIGELSMQDILILFSEPALVRTEGDARHWQYRSSRCLLDIFVASAPDAEQTPVLHYEFRPRRTASLTAAGPEMVDMPDQRACIESLSFRP